MDRKTRQNIKKDIEDLNDTISQPDKIDICRTLHPSKVEFTFFPSVYGTFSWIDHILGH